MKFPLIMFLVSKLKSSLHDLVNRYVRSVLQLTTDMFRLSSSQPGPFLIHDLSPCKKSNTTSATSRTGTDYPSRVYESSPPIFSGGCLARFSAFCVVFCRSLFLSFLIRPTQTHYIDSTPTKFCSFSLIMRA